MLFKYFQELNINSHNFHNWAATLNLRCPLGLDTAELSTFPEACIGCPSTLSYSSPPR